MTSVKEIYDYIDSFAPFSSQLDFDNAGINVGDEKAQVTKAVVSLDITAKVADYAESIGANLVISHHPVLFTPIKYISSDSVAYRLAQRGLTALCAHTNLDAAAGGVNDALAKVLGLSDIEMFEQDAPDVWFGRIGNLPYEMSPAEFSRYTAKCLSLPYVFCSKHEGTIRRVGVIGGGAGEYYLSAKAAGADAYITGEAHHHEFIAAAHENIMLVAAGHYATEAVVLRPLADMLAARFPEVEFVVTEIDNPMLTLG
ncbi:MAG: Nif3-like dinuclear metal center hexameric protein [Oscillospiraceae bacterium]|jgi:dinuclear metal center YbgI/SA1388 family protein|nr:Nif3-like dinuclear metal center hexameric protein [Oscillospiraceae bacterium]